MKCPIGTAVNEPQCAVCESTEAEGKKLVPIHTAEGVVLLCSWPCMYIAATHCFCKCRRCGSVATIQKEKIPGGLTLGCNSFIIFTEECAYCKITG